MRFAGQDYWNYNVGPFPLYARTFDREPLNEDEFFWQQQRRHRFRAKIRSRHKRVKGSRLYERQQLAQLESTTWGMF